MYLQVNDLPLQDSQPDIEPVRVTPAPSEKTEPIEDKLTIVPPPPPLTFSIEASDSNTQSDVDSDVLDSSRSELENIYRNAESYLGDDPGDTPRVKPEDVGGYDLIFKEKDLSTVNSKLSEPNLISTAKVKKGHETSNQNKVFDSSGDESSSVSGFEKHLAVLTNELDAHLKAELPSATSASSPSRSSSTRSSTTSTDSVIKSPRKEFHHPQMSESEQNNTKMDSELDTAPVDVRVRFKLT